MTANGRHVAMLGRAGLLGAATGLRSTVALAALVVRRNDGLPAALGHPAFQAAAAIACAGELVADKLPTTPSRVRPPLYSVATLVPPPGRS